MPECTECQFSDEKNGVVFTHRVKEHTDAGDGDSFNLYDDEVFDIYVDMAVQEARENCLEKDKKPTVENVKYELGELGVSFGVEQSLIQRGDA
jgi:hypothetical protein